VARTGEKEMYTVFCWRNLQEKRHLESLFIDERITLKCLWETRIRGRGLDQSGSANGQLADCCEHGDEPLVSIKWGGFIDYITYC